MEDNTKHGSGVQPPTDSGRLSIDAADLLVSSQSGWDAAPAPKFADACDSLRVYGVYLDNGVTTSNPVKCNSWDDQPCAEKHAIEELGKFINLLAGAEVAFHARVPVTEFVPRRLSDRRNRWQGKVGRVWYRWYRRADGKVWVIASHPLGGRDEPRVFTQTNNPLRFAAVALRQPGVRRVDGSSVKKAQRELVESLRAAAKNVEESDSAESDTDDPERVEVEAEDDNGPKVKWFKPSSHDRWEERTEVAAVVAKELYGVDVNPAYPVVSGSGFTVEQWVECLKVAESRM